MYRIQSEDIVADIKDTILHCQLFKVLPCVFTASAFLTSLKRNAPSCLKTSSSLTKKPQ